MHLHVRPNASGTGWIAYDDDGHSAGAATENEVLLAFRQRHPDVELSEVDMDDEPVEMLGTMEEQARHQALLDGEAVPDHIHGDLSTCLQYINSLAARVEVLEQGAIIGEPVALVGSDRLTAAEGELAMLRTSLATDWRNFVFEPSHAEIMLIGVLPLLRSLIHYGPQVETLAAITQWFESIADERDALVMIAEFLTHDIDGLPEDVAQSVKHVFGL